MDVYTPTFDGDLALLAWWLHLGETGDLEKVFGRGVQRLGMFTRQFDPPTELLYAKDDKGWCAAAWTWPLMDGCTFSLWVREDIRQTRSAFAFIAEAFQRAFEKYPVVLFVTRSESVLRQAMRFGFKLLGEVPYFFDGESAFIGVATPFDFETAMQPSLKETH